MRLKFFALFVCLLGAASLLTAAGQDWQWLRRAGGTNIDLGKAIVTDNAGNSYVTGMFAGTAAFGTNVLYAYGSTDIFIARIGANGNWVWVRQAGGYYEDCGCGIALDSSGNVCVTGYFSGGGNFGATYLGGYGDKDTFACKLDASGNWIWAKQVGSTGVDTGQAIALDGSDNVFVTGQFNGNAVAVYKLSAAGVPLTANGALGTGIGIGRGIAVDYYGSVYVAGILSGNLSFGAANFTSFGGEDIFVAKLTNTLNWDWVRQAGGTGDDEGTALATDASGCVYCTGRFSGSAQFGSLTLTALDSDVFVAKLDSAGNLGWVSQAGGTLLDESFGIAVDADRVYICGVYWADMVVGNTVLPLVGESNMFAATLNHAGNWLWAIKAGGSHWTVGRGICPDPAGNIITTGSFFMNSNFGNVGMSASGSDDVFVCRIGYSKPAAPQISLVTMQAHDLILFWDPVYYSVYDQLLMPDYYFVYKSPGQPSGPFYLIRPTLEAYFNHQYVGLVEPRMFYRVTAVKIYDTRSAAGPDRAEVDAYLQEHLREGMTEAEVAAVLRALPGNWIGEER